MGPVDSVTAPEGRRMACAIWRSRGRTLVLCRASPGSSVSDFRPISGVAEDGPRLASPHSRGAVLEVSLEYNSRARFTAEARHHRVVLDQPTEDGSTDQGMSPAELLLASLGGCVGQYVAQYLTVRGVSPRGLTVRVRTQPSLRALHLGKFEVEVLVPGLSDRQLRTLEKSFPAGLVQNAIRFESPLEVGVVTVSTRKNTR